VRQRAAIANIIPAALVLTRTPEYSVISA